MTLPHPLLPMAAGELPWGHQSWGAGPAPHLGSTEELALDVGLLLSQVQGHECGRASPASYLLCSGISEGEILFLFLLPLPWMAGRESWPQWGHESRRDGPAPHLHLTWATE